MKVSINPETGAMEFDATPEEAVALMRLQRATVTAVTKASKAKAEDPAPTVKEAATAAGLTQALYLVWDYLVQHENVKKGVTLSAIARHLRITNAATGCRLNKLVEYGYVERLSRGRYKALLP